MSKSHRWTFHRSDLFKNENITTSWSCYPHVTRPEMLTSVPPGGHLPQVRSVSNRRVASQNGRKWIRAARNEIFSAVKMFAFHRQNFHLIFFFCRFELQNSHGPKVRGQCISSDRLPVRKRPAMASQAARCELRQPRYNHYETPKLVALPSICWLSLWRVYVDCKLISREAQI